MDFAWIIYWLMKRLQPLLWHTYRLGVFLELAVRVLESREDVAYMAERPWARADFESKLSDAEHFLDYIIAFKASALLGRACPPPSGPCARIHCATSLEQLSARLSRLLHRVSRLDQLARFRANRLRKEIERGRAQLEADPIRQVRAAAEACALALSGLAAASQAHGLRLAAAVAAAMRKLAPLSGMRIRAPP